VREPEALTRLKSARNRRETYIGPWLPEPVVEPAEGEVDDITLPLRVALERLSLLERAAFLLHEVSVPRGRQFDARVVGENAAVMLWMKSAG
jgi:RNA polymerase sigma-70 factor (ECF subfamily)